MDSLHFKDFADSTLFLHFLIAHKFSNTLVISGKNLKIISQLPTYFYILAHGHCKILAIDRFFPNSFKLRIM